MQQLRDADGDITSNAKSLFMLLARRAKSLSLKVTLTTSSTRDVGFAAKIAADMMSDASLQSEQLRVGVEERRTNGDSVQESFLTVSITNVQPMAEKSNEFPVQLAVSSFYPDNAQRFRDHCCHNYSTRFDDTGSIGARSCCCFKIISNGIGFKKKRCWCHCRQRRHVTTSAACPAAIATTISKSFAEVKLNVDSNT